MRNQIVLSKRMMSKRILMTTMNKIRKTMKIVMMEAKMMKRMKKKRKKKNKLMFLKKCKLINPLIKHLFSAELKKKIE